MVVVASLAEPALPAEGISTAGMLLLRRGLAADEDAPLRGVELELSAELAELETPAPEPERRGEVAFVDEVDAPLEA